MKKFYILLLPILCAQIGWAQIEQVFDINEGEGNSSPNNLFVFGSAIYFGADDSGGTNSPGDEDLGRELWKSDGTAAGTSFVSNLRTGDAGSSPGNFFEYNGSLYFSANSGSGSVLFSSDGTTAGTAATGDGFVFNPTPLDGLIYFVDTTTGNSLNQFNGTSSALVAGSGSESLIGATMIAYQDKIFCYMDEATDEPTIGRELYAYDPAIDSFNLIKDITESNEDSGISNFTILGTNLYFEALGKLWKTDGTTAGTLAVAAAEAEGIDAINNFYAWNGKLFFEGDNGSDDQLWIYDPTLDTVTNVSNVTGNHDPSDFAPLGDFLYYSGKVEGDTESYLFRTDGAITVRLDSDIFGIDDIVALDGVLYFEAENTVIGRELFKLDPTTLTVSNAIVLAKSVSIYPNPATSVLNLKSASNFDFKYSIIDINGRELQSGNVVNKQISIDLATGLYILQLKAEKQPLVLKKIIIE
ncbi:T9SS type A sorting domain-containing protein [Subsaximicrobium wynnwilliamsii]|uniref:T9SS type A sorting domain-containing protein n=1 Tax=Subsaximicrobium wynnwilliamsii TaxID=291179 RepID=A0A5C6ZDN2_9FLAO|nr:T9SS type A sorting domain-containing protein [Subsaximicrobium wynnwilliamsii]TXD82207.1 T9SS type A sorting domain-containing protein [Subsaximicrobium wynnwilliamsii]TXD87847.1 T9SS type A sorting domain-containing protein [Subsaximicrobium wynnwilliamsii]TXE01797.1 T9SS type A sorting domain-containing protein [Subsaximicrobium wynnwilliamsii]